MINLELYKIFKMVADEENLTKASEKLYISQPAITKHIKNLESELNIQLFKRSKYGMILNENGKKLYNQVKDSIEILQKADQIFKTNNTVNLAVHVNMPEKIYSKFISKFYEENKDIIINIEKLFAKGMFSELENEDIDFAFSKKYDEKIYNTNKIKFIKIGELHDDFIVNSNSKYLERKLTKNDLRNTTIYTLQKFSSAYKNLVKELGYNEDDENNIENISFTAMMELLKINDVITVMTKEYVEESIDANELNILNVGFTLPYSDYGIYYNINNKDNNIKKMIEIFKEKTLQ